MTGPDVTGPDVAGPDTVKTGDRGPGRAVLKDFLRRAQRPERLVASGDALLHRLSDPRSGRIVTINLFELYHYVHDPVHRAFVNSAQGWTADGWPVVRALRKVGVVVDRVTGSGLCADLLALPRDVGPRTIAVLGSEDRVVDAFAGRLAEQGRELVYRNTGARDDWRRDDVRGPLRASDPDVVLVAVGTPHGVEVAAGLEPFLPSSSVVAVGAGVGLAVGMERRAAPLVQALHLEWAWRMVADPRRLARRYLLECVPLLPSLLAAARSLARTTNT